MTSNQTWQKIATIIDCKLIKNGDEILHFFKDESPPDLLDTSRESILVYGIATACDGVNLQFRSPGLGGYVGVNTILKVDAQISVEDILEGGHWWFRSAGK